MVNTNNIANDMDTIVESLNNLNIDVSSSISQEIDYNIVKWYVDRFNMLRSDGVPTAIPMYLRRLQLRKDVNDVTKAYIIALA